MNEKKMFLLDAYALIFRSYYAFINNPRRTTYGLNTSAIFGFVLTLDELLRKEKPSHIAVAFDPPGGTFRHKMYDKYKAQRKATPEDIIASTPFIKRLIEAYNIPVFEIPNYEADDVIGTISVLAEKEGFKVYMVTSDKDFTQLVTDNVFVYKPRHAGIEVEIMGIAEVKKEFQVKPSQVPDVLGLWGDASDNIPGAPGIGEKRSKEIIKTFGSIEEVYKRLHHFKGKQKENLIQYKDQILLSKTLATIETAVPLTFNSEQLKYNGMNIEKVKNLFEELEFKTLIERITGNPELFDKTSQQTASNLQNTEEVANEKNIEPNKKVEEVANEKIFEPNVKVEISTIKTNPHTYKLISTTEERKWLAEQLATQKEFCFDTETTGLDVLEAQLLGIAVAWKENEAYYMPVEGNKEQKRKQLADFVPIFKNPDTLKIGQNIKFDIEILQNLDIEICGKLFDTMIAHYLLEPDKRHNMDILAEEFLRYKPVSIEELIGKKGKNQRNMADVPLNIIKEYSAEDADITFRLKKVFEQKLIEQKLDKLFYEIEMPLIYTLAGMELSGVKINTEYLKLYSIELVKEIAEIEKTIFSMAGCEFNISSPKQLGEILFDRLKIIDNAKKTKTDQYSTSEPELMKLKSKHKIIEHILEFRSLKKLLNTYVDTLPELINKTSEKIHTSYNQAVAATGRLSSNNPNLQNIPIKTAHGREIRKAFIPSNHDYLIISADYSQIESRLMAHFAQDAGMIEAFNNKQDIHAATAAKIYKIPQEQVTKEMRSNAKSANFGIIYGISAFGLSQNLNISRSEAKILIDGYFESYPGVKKYMENSIATARKQLYVETIMGRKRQLTDINSQNSIVRGIAERNAINAPIQGSAADIIKIAMINIQTKIKQNSMKSKMIMQVHDELVFDVFKPELDELKTLVINEMQSALKLSVPLIVDVGIGENWLEAH